jgi:hypothetical protein
MAILVLSFGCGDDGKGQQLYTDPTDAGSVPTTPTQPTVPTTPSSGTAQCHPALQLGCQAGQKCAAVISGTTAATRCVTDGQVLPGQACAVDATTGVDNCVAGYNCASGTCKVICSQVLTPLLCSASGGTCAAQPAIFGDVPNDRVGLCADTCDPLQQNCKDAGNGCYLDISAGAASCASVAVGAADHRQNAACVASADGTCASNGCAPGFTPTLPASFASNTTVCTQFCSPVDTHTGATSNAAGNPAFPVCPAGDECRFVQTFFRDATNVSAAIGMCVSRAAFGTCTTCNISSMTTAAQTCVAQHAFGCVSSATSATILPF